MPSTTKPQLAEPQYADARTAQQALKFVFVAALLIAGSDKYMHHLVNWDQYLCPLAQHVLGRFSHPFMLLAGASELTTAVLLIIPATTRFAAYMLSAVLFCIMINLLLCGQYYDIALRDLGLCIGAFALGKLTYNRQISNSRS